MKKNGKYLLTKEEQDELDDFMFLKDNPEGIPSCPQCMFFDTDDCPYIDVTEFSCPEDFDCRRFFS